MRIWLKYITYKYNNKYIITQKYFLILLLFPSFLGTSVLAGFAIFSILGHMAHSYEIPVEQVVKEGQSTNQHWQIIRIDRKCLSFFLCFFFILFVFVQGLVWPSLHIQMLCPSFPYHLCGPSCSLSCFWQLAWTPSLQG